MRGRKLLMMVVLAIVMLVFSIVPVSASTVEVSRVPAPQVFVVAPACNITGKREDTPRTDYFLGPSTGPPMEVTPVVENSQRNDYVATESGQEDG